MKILTTVKRVTDPDAKIRIKPDGSGIVTEGIEFKMNPFDEIGVEEALRIKSKVGGEVVVASIGPSESTKEIRTALAMGGDRGILVETNEALDSSVVALILARFLPETHFFQKLMLAEQIDSRAELRTGPTMPGLVGMRGTALTPLHPAGFGTFKGKRMNVVARGDFIQKDASIVIAEAHGNRIVVEQTEA